MRRYESRAREKRKRRKRPRSSEAAREGGKVMIAHESCVTFPQANKWTVVEPRDVLNVYEDDELLATVRQWQYVAIGE